MEKYDPELNEGPPRWGENYVSAADNVQAIKRQFAEEEELGMMIKMLTKD